MNALVAVLLFAYSNITQRVKKEHKKNAQFRMQGIIVTDEDVSLALKIQNCVGIIEKGQENFRVRMGKDQRVEFPCRGTHDARDIYSYMGAFVGYTGLLALSGPTSPRPRIAFNSGFIEIPDLYIAISEVQDKLLQECRSFLFVLSIGPGPRHLQTKSLVMKPTHHGAVSHFMFKLLGEVSVELLGGSVHLVGSVRMLDKFLVYRSLFWSDLGRSSTFRTINESVNALVVESAHLLGERPSGDIKDSGYLIPDHPKQQRLDCRQAHVTPPRHRYLCGRFKIYQEAVLAVGLGRRAADDARSEVVTIQAQVQPGWVVE